MKTKSLSPRTTARLILIVALIFVCRPGLAAAPIIVTSLADNGPGTLRNAILAAVDGVDTIQVQAGLAGTITLASELGVAKTLPILGLGPKNSSIVNPNGCVFHLTGPGKTAAISGFRIVGTVTGANGTDGTQRRAPNGTPGSGVAGGGMQLEAMTLGVVSNCFFQGCQAIAGHGGNGYDNSQNSSSVIPGNGGKGGTACGGAIYNRGGDLQVIRCAFSANVAIGGAGGHAYDTGVGGIGGDAMGGAICDEYNGVDIYVVDCTFYGNTAYAGDGGIGGDGDAFTGPHAGGNGGNGGAAYGGALSFSVGCPLPFDCTGLIHDTICQNSVSFGPGGAGGKGKFGFVDGSPGVNGSANGGGMHHVMGAGSIDVGNTVVAANFASFRTTTGAFVVNGLDVFGDYVSHSYNLIGTLDGSSSGWAALDLMGTAAIPLDPRLGPFQDNGGETMTMAPLVCSPLIDAGTTQNVNRDQIHQHRPVVTTLAALPGLGSDIGAFELQSYPPIGNVLSIDRTQTGGNVVISWPADLSCFHLQSNTNFNPSSWITVTNPASINGSLDQVVLPASAQALFFRLIQP